MVNFDFSNVGAFWESLKKVPDDPWFISVVAAGLATWMGARAAEKTSIKNSKREAALAEIRDINHAIMVSYSVGNTMLVFKKQLILNLVHEYFEGRRKFFHDVGNPRAGDVDDGRRVVSVKSNLVSIDAPVLPLDSLDSLIFNKISSGSRCLAATIQLREYYSNLTSAIQTRRNIIENRSSKLTPHAYYGYPHQGVVDSRYHDSIVGIKNYVDDLIFFSTIICDDLMVSGNSAFKNFKKEHGKGAPLIDRVNFEKAYAEGLVPFKSNYSSWLSGFGNHPEKVHSIRKLYLKVILFWNFLFPFISLSLVIDVAILLLMCALLGLAILR